MKSSVGTVVRNESTTKNHTPNNATSIFFIFSIVPYTVLKVIDFFLSVSAAKISNLFEIPKCMRMKLAFNPICNSWGWVSSFPFFFLPLPSQP